MNYRFVSFLFLILLISVVSIPNVTSETASPTSMPTSNPTLPTESPTKRPSVNPTERPTKSPIAVPSVAPSTPYPTTAYPTSKSPTQSPVTNKPSKSPTESPTKTRRPSRSPSRSPTESPTKTRRPTKEPTILNCENYPGDLFDDKNKQYLDCESGYRCGKDISLSNFCFLESSNNRTILCNSLSNKACYRNSDCVAFGFNDAKCMMETFCSGEGRCFKFSNANLTPYPTSRPTTAPTTTNPSTSPTRRPTTSPLATTMPTNVPSFAPTSSPTPKQVASEDAAVWAEFYDATNGQNWPTCSETRNSPCDCNDKTSGNYVKCETESAASSRIGNRRVLYGNSIGRELADTTLRITEIKLRNNNIQVNSAKIPFKRLSFLRAVDMTSDSKSATPNKIQSSTTINCYDFQYCYVPGIKCQFSGSGDDLCLRDWGIDPKYVLFAAGVSFGSLISCCCCFYYGQTVRKRRRLGKKAAGDEEEYEGGDEEGEAPAVPARASAKQSLPFPTIGDEENYEFTKRMSVASAVSSVATAKEHSYDSDPDTPEQPPIVRKKSLIRKSSKRLTNAEKQRLKRVEALYESGMMTRDDVLELIPDFFEIQEKLPTYGKDSIRWVDKENQGVSTGPVSQVVKILDYENEESNGNDSIRVNVAEFEPHHRNNPSTDNSVDRGYNFDNEANGRTSNNSSDTSNSATTTAFVFNDGDDIVEEKVDIHINDESNARGVVASYLQAGSSENRRSSSSSSDSFTGDAKIFEMLRIAEETGQSIPSNKRPTPSKVQFLFENEEITAEQALILCPDIFASPTSKMSSMMKEREASIDQQDPHDDEKQQEPELLRRTSASSVPSTAGIEKPSFEMERSNSLIQKALALLGVDEKTKQKRSLSKQLERKRKLDSILSNPDVFTSFLDEHARFFKSEHVLFWNAVDRFEKYRGLAVKSKSAYQDMAQAIIDEFVKDDSPNYVLLPEQVQSKILSKRREQYTPEMFVEAKREVMRAMNIDFINAMEKSSNRDQLDEILDQFDILVGEIAEQNLSNQMAKDLDSELGPVGNLEKHDEDEKVNLIMGLGFSKSLAMKALEAHNNDVEAAAQDLITNQSGFEENDSATDIATEAGATVVKESKANKKDEIIVAAPVGAIAAVNKLERQRSEEEEAASVAQSIFSEPSDVDRYRTPSFDGRPEQVIASPAISTEAVILKKKSEESSTISPENAELLKQIQKGRSQVSLIPPNEDITVEDKVDFVLPDLRSHLIWNDKLGIFVYNDENDKDVDILDSDDPNEEKKNDDNSIGNDDDANINVEVEEKMDYGEIESTYDVNQNYYQDDEKANNVIIPIKEVAPAHPLPPPPPPPPPRLPSTKGYSASTAYQPPVAYVNYFQQPEAQPPAMEEPLQQYNTFGDPNHHQQVYSDPNYYNNNKKNTPQSNSNITSRKVSEEKNNDAPQIELTLFEQEQFANGQLNDAPQEPRKSNGKAKAVVKVAESEGIVARNLRIFQAKQAQAQAQAISSARKPPASTQSWKKT